MHELSLYLLNLILLPYSLSYQEGRCHSYPRLVQHVNLLLHVGAFRMIALTGVCALAHFSFVLFLLEVLLGALGLLLRPVLVYLLLRWLLSFLLAF